MVPSRIAALFGGSILHIGRAKQNDGLKENDIDVDFEDDTTEEISRDLSKRWKK